MTSHSRHNSAIKVIDPLYRISTILALSPPYNFKKSLLKSRRNHKIYALFVILFIIIGYILSTMGRICNCYPHFPTTTLMITDALYYLTQTISNVLSIMILSLLYPDALVKFLNTFDKIESRICKPNNDGGIELTKKFFTRLVLGHLCLVVLFSYDAYLWVTKLGLIQFRAYCFRDFQTYSTVTAVMLIHALTIAIERRFYWLNHNLETTTDSKKTYCSFLNEFSCVRTVRMSPNTIQQLTRVYEMLIEQISTFNKIFGWQILLTTTVTIMGLLNTLDIMLSYTIFNNYLSPTTFGTELIVLSVFWSLLGLGMGAVMAASCDSASKEAQRTSELCYKLLINLPAVPEKVEEQDLREQLLLLAQLSSQRCPNFTAAGFFKVDYSMLLAVFSSVTSYIIVVIQFNK